MGAVKNLVKLLILVEVAVALAGPGVAALSMNYYGVYFKELQQRRGLLSSDQTLYESPETQRLVNMFAMNQGYFFYAFTQGMGKMGQIDLKEGDRGEVRKSCRVVNKPSW
uniref:Plant heme peroxidase family profile domain-containing protein n=1 Tax=Triticum urartu TaxID=4572 RepID=A0A8R7V7T4_TRIUA